MFKTALMQETVRERFKEWGDKVGWCPNIGLCLIVSEIRSRKEFACDPILLYDIKKSDTQEKIFEIVKKERYGLVGLHTVGLLEQLDAFNAILGGIKTSSPETKIVVGGPDSIFSLNNPLVDFVISGNGQKSFASLVEAVYEGKSLYEVPNLFFRIEKGGRTLIEHSRKLLPYNINDFLPFKPALDWRVVGRKQRAEFEYGVLMSALGCYHNKSVIKSRYYKDIDFSIDYIDLFGIPKNLFTPFARGVIEDKFKNRSSGCTFCDIHFDKNYTCIDMEGTVNLLLTEANFWVDYWDKEGDGGRTKILAITNEGPLRALLEFLSRVDPHDHHLEVWMDVRADDFLRSEKLINEALEACRDKKVTLVIGPVGFESFSQRSLDIYNKGTRVRENVKSIELLRRIKRKYGDKFRLDVSGSFVLFNPWLGLDELETNLKFFRTYKVWDLIPYPLSTSYLRCYRGTSIYEKARQEALLKDKKWQLVAPWKFKDRRVETVFELLTKITEIMTKGSEYYDWKKLNKLEVECMERIVKIIRNNEGANPYLLRRLCMRDVRELLESRYASPS